jgi:hypothetical protein
MLLRGRLARSVGSTRLVGRCSKEPVLKVRRYRLKVAVLHTFRRSRILVELSLDYSQRTIIGKARLKALHSVCLLKLNETMRMAHEALGILEYAPNSLYKS